MVWQLQKSIVTSFQAPEHPKAVRNTQQMYTQSSTHNVFCGMKKLRIKTCKKNILETVSFCSISHKTTSFWISRMQIFFDSYYAASPWNILYRGFSVNAIRFERYVSVAVDVILVVYDDGQIADGTRLTLTCLSVCRISPLFHTCSRCFSLEEQQTHHHSDRKNVVVGKRVREHLEGLWLALRSFFLVCRAFWRLVLHSRAWILVGTCLWRLSWSSVEVVQVGVDVVLLYRRLRR